MDRSIEMDSQSAALPAAARVRCVLRIRPSPAWTAEEDARLERLAKEHGSRHWRRVASHMPGRSSRQCRDLWRHHLARDVYHRPFTASDDADLARLYVRHAGCWRDISRAVHGRTSRVMRRRWKEVRHSDAILGKLWRPLPPAGTDDASDSSSTSFPSQKPHSDVVALCSSSLGRRHVPRTRAHLHARHLTEFLQLCKRISASI